MKRTRITRKHIGPLMSVLVLVALAGCRPSSDREVVVYTALDREFSEPLFDQFTRDTGIKVRAKYDTEANKTVGLTNLILGERERPRCQVFWNNEILNTLRLDQAGLLTPFASAQGARYPAQYRSARSTWYGFAARARVLLVNTERIEAASRPQSIMDLTADKWNGQVGIAKPIFGTTATHAACLFSVWGTERAEAFFREIHEKAVVLPGNRQVAQAVGSGQLAFGLTDTDDAMLEIEQGSPVEIVYPDQGEAELGTLFIPNTIGIIENSGRRALAQQLVEYLLSPQVEAQLADGPSAQIPLHPDTAVKARVETPRSVHAMKVDFQAAAEGWERTAKFLRTEFQ